MSEKKEAVIFKSKWKEHHQKILEATFPDASEEHIDDFLERKFKEEIKVPMGIIHNNYINQAANIDLLGLVDWIDRVEPVIAGNGTFFKNQDQAENPSAIMLESFLVNRKKYKDLLHVYKEDTYEYDTANRLQNTEKTNVNSYYGGSGNTGFIFYNLYCAVATTATAQSLISTTETAFEAFLSNNVPFVNLDDCIAFINNTINEERLNDDSFLKDINRSKLVDRLVSNFYYGIKSGEKFRPTIEAYVETLEQEEVNRVYYKNNLYEFTLLPKIYGMIYKVLVKTASFKNPNKLPENTKSILTELWGLYEEFVMYNHFAFNRIQRLKYERRKSVIVVDTDSKLFNWSHMVVTSY